MSVPCHMTSDGRVNLQFRELVHAQSVQLEKWSLLMVLLFHQRQTSSLRYSESVQAQLPNDPCSLNEKVEEFSGDANQNPSPPMATKKSCSLSVRDMGGVPGVLPSTIGKESRSSTTRGWDNKQSRILVLWRRAGSCHRIIERTSTLLH